MDKRKNAVRRVQDLIIVLLTCSALFLAGSLPLFGELSDTSLIALARERFRESPAASESRVQPLRELALPVRMASAGSFASSRLTLAPVMVLSRSMVWSSALNLTSLRSSLWSTRTILSRSTFPPV